MTFEPLLLFRDKKEGFLLFGVLLFVFILHSGFIYLEYLEFSKIKFHKTVGTLEALYQKRNKNNKPYRVLRLKTEKFTLYTTSWKKSLDMAQGDRVQFTFISKNITFLNFLSRRFFAPAFSFRRQKTIANYKTSLEKFISKQHDLASMNELYLALFLAKPISKELRQYVQNWGISHLIAISGFHLGVLSFVLFFMVNIIYRPLQDRFFPYRDRKFDIGCLIFLFLAAYLYIIDFTPSFLRSFVMSLLGFIFYMRYIKILSFVNLALTAALLLAIFPHLVFSIGFRFSILGVFYIFLYFHHFQNKFPNFVHGVLINIWVFLGMVIPVHGIFGYTSWQQFGSIFLSLLFIVFYPLAIFFHIIGYGELLDIPLERLLHMDFGGKIVVLESWQVFSYMVLSFVSIFQRNLAIFTILLGLLVFFV